MSLLAILPGWFLSLVGVITTLWYRGKAKEYELKLKSAMEKHEDTKTILFAKEDQVSRLKKVIEDQDVKLEECNKLLAEHLGADGARHWLSELLSSKKGSGEAS